MTTIERIEVIRTSPDNRRLVVVKVHTSEPGLYGVGCATATFRDGAIERAIEELAPLAIGRDALRIEDFYNAAMNDAYWRNGPIGNCAVSGIDMALWDILGKVAGLPVYQLLGGKSRDRRLKGGSFAGAGGGHLVHVRAAAIGSLYRGGVWLVDTRRASA